MGLPFGLSKRPRRDDAEQVTGSDAAGHQSATMTLGRNRQRSPRIRTWSVGGDTGHSEDLHQHRPSERSLLVPPERSSSRIIRHFLPHGSSTSEQHQQPQDLTTDSNNQSTRQRNLLNHHPQSSLTNDSSPLDEHNDNHEHRHFQTQTEGRWHSDDFHHHETGALNSRVAPPEHSRRRSPIAGTTHDPHQTLILNFAPLAPTTRAALSPPPAVASRGATPAYDTDSRGSSLPAWPLAAVSSGGAGWRSGSRTSHTHHNNKSTNHSVVTATNTPLQAVDDVFSPSDFSHYSQPRYSSREASQGFSQQHSADAEQSQQHFHQQQSFALVHDPAETSYEHGSPQRYHHHHHQQSHHQREHSAVSEVPQAAPSSSHQLSESRKRLSRFSLRNAFGSLLRSGSIRKKVPAQGNLAEVVGPVTTSALASHDHHANDAPMDGYPHLGHFGPDSATNMYDQAMSAHLQHEQLQLQLQHQQQHQQYGRPLPSKAEPFPAIWHSSEDEETDGSSAMPGEMFQHHRGLPLASGTRHRSATSATGRAPSIISNSSRQGGGRRRGGSLTVPASSSMASGSNPASRSSCRRDDDDEDDVLAVHSQGVAAPPRVGLQTSRSSILDHTHAPNASLHVHLLDPRTGSYSLQPQGADGSAVYQQRPPSSRQRRSSRGLEGEAGLAQSVVHEDRREDTTSLISSPRSSSGSHHYVPEPEPVKTLKPLSTLRKFFAGRSARTSNPTPVPNGLVQQGAHSNWTRALDEGKRAQLPLPPRAATSMEGPIHTNHQPSQAVYASKRASLGPIGIGHSYVDGFRTPGPDSPPAARLRASDSWTDDRRNMLLPNVTLGSLPTSPVRGRAGSMKKRENSVTDRLRFHRKQSLVVPSDSDNNMSRSGSHNTFASAHSVTDRALTLQALKGASVPTPQHSPEKKAGAIGPASSFLPGISPSVPVTAGPSNIPSIWTMVDEASNNAQAQEGLPLTTPTMSAVSYNTASPQLSDIASSNLGRSPVEDHSPGRHSASTFNPMTPRTDPQSIVRPNDPVTCSGGRRTYDRQQAQRSVDTESGASFSSGKQQSESPYKRRNTFGDGNDAGPIVRKEGLQSSVTSDLFHSPAPPSLQESFVLEIERDLRAVEKALVNNRREGSFDPTSLRKRLSTLMPKVSAAQPTQGPDSHDSEESGSHGRNRVTLSSTSQLAILDAVRRLKTSIDESQILDGLEEGGTAEQTRASIEIGDLSNASKLSGHQKGLKEIEMAYDRMRDLVTSAIGVSAASTPVVSSSAISKRTRANLEISTGSGTPSARARTQSTTAIPTPAAPLTSPIQGPRYPSDSARTKRLSALMGLPHPPREVSSATSQAETIRNSMDVENDRPKREYRFGSGSASGSVLAARLGLNGPTPGSSTTHHREGSSVSARRQTPGRGGRETESPRQQGRQGGSSGDSPRSGLLSLASPPTTFGYSQGATEFGSMRGGGAGGMSPGALTRSLPTSHRAGMARSPWTVSSGLTSVFNSGEGAALSEPDNNPVMEMMRRRHELERNSLLDALEQTRTENAHLQTANRQLQSDLHAEVTRVLQLERELQRQMDHGETLGLRLVELDQRVGELQGEIEHLRQTETQPSASVLERYELSISRLPSGQSPIGLSDQSDEDEGSDLGGSGNRSVTAASHGIHAMSSPTVVPSIFKAPSGATPSRDAAPVESKVTRPRPTSSPSLHNYPSVLGLKVDERELEWTLADERQPRGASPSPDKLLRTEHGNGGASSPEDLMSAPFPSIPTSQFLERNTRVRDSPLGVSSTISTSPNSFNNASGPASTDRTSAVSESVGDGSGSLRGLGLHPGRSTTLSGASGGSGKRGSGLPMSSSSSSASPRHRRATYEEGDHRKVSAATTGASSSFTAQTESPAASFVSGFAGPVSRTFRDMLQEDDSVNQ
ncbi:unnamed protein product [Tilletia controversa]|uniref:Uncharacterized protein n=2 Tax=Tilletia TaxID=13289 RepID=A0A177VE69_9BASI|nr:hypothetical protein CF336_g20 [Tilletia laevis]KAE8265639.1 hypothetical protein A4X03_0g130 [Tilletia caries]CAD6948741.1 unnamed protein product [Tilletia controversa]KAE8208967.1 hypothetical protein CF335_g22 [Tilletia laevis]CAD6883893.1 unnamed protein product [Tilletia caries]